VFPPYLRYRSEVSHHPGTISLKDDAENINLTDLYG